MIRFCFFCLSFALFLLGAFALAMCIITGEGAPEVWAVVGTTVLTGCWGVGKFLDCYV